MSRPRKKPPHLVKGELGENLAVRHLRFRGYRIIERNYRCRLGEIDIIARRKGVLVFTEVRSRTEPFLTDPASTVDEVKIARTINTAKHYIMENNLLDIPCRFDVLAVTLRPNRRPDIDHVHGAFDLSSDLPDDAARRGARRQAINSSRSFPVKKKEI